MIQHKPPRRFPSLVLLCLLLTGVCYGNACAQGIRHYVFFDLERERIHDRTFLATKAFAGAQLKYTWRELEPNKDAYDFRAIRKDLAFLTSQGKRLFIQLQDVTFAPTVLYVPKYLVDEKMYHGGADKQYNIAGEDEAHATTQGWVARRWDKTVQARFHKLLFALGKAFDGKIEGVNLPETAVDFGETGRLYPKGFTPALYRDAILTNLAALKRAFHTSVTMQYANFMPGEWLPDTDRGYLRSVYRRAGALKVGVGGPDMLPYRPGQMHHSYPLIRAAHGSVPTGIAVQEGNYDAKNPRTGQPMTIADLMAFAHDYLKVDYVFWCTQEPFYSQKLLPYLRTHSTWQ
jgi:hypothetical protein